MSELIQSGPRWVARLDARKTSGDYSELLRSIAAYFDMYERGYKYLGPWISRSSSMVVTIPPEKDAILRALGKPRSNVHSLVHTSFIDALFDFAVKSKGRRQLINPDPTTHHSSQFVKGTFSIKPTKDGTHSIALFGCPEPILVEGLKISPSDINFIIVRPKIGKLGTASAIQWEVLFYKTPHGYLIDHVDSSQNPRYAGIM